MSSQDFCRMIGDVGWSDEPLTIQAIVKFHELLLEENKKQNLTRLISEKDFIEGHLIDVKELLNSGLLSFPAMDLGSGGGVPGLLGAVIRPDQWVLTDSEGRKADFLQKSVNELGIADRVKVFSGRGEQYLSTHRVQSIVARAVGPVERIFSWIEKCSTWNNLVLLKGPGWEREWGEFLQSRYRKRLKIASRHDYVVGAEQKSRCIVRLERVL